jgi:hypothetical protein
MSRLSEIQERHESDKSMIDAPGLGLNNFLKDRAYLLSLVDRMKPYLEHSEECVFNSFAKNDRKCSCGLAELLEELDD